jgi:hypothetical protein
LRKNGKDRRTGDEVDVPDKQTLEKLDLLATGRLSELSTLASPAEKSAAAKLLAA